ncbi:MAG: L-aspartate oxidase [Ignavibacteria bacterium RIFOXYB2_FULL_35_12]|nr:MAG: L-aspartate oxidase [Ignavibacteria bacterium GWA2_36_19]OGU57987.1 MAG: L-aspartate oxidase [Ignavibacteria bacterium GWF2_35_20]OGU78054.1 MAG: L-aspartate oxidase [Ignavibacteria bacterium RIFOXYA2_FULL_35_9]OGU90516.1 MAG: L-aspartate oxidase [Ignavibacteria bacterium RIFOXYC12_FULL_35_11]OGU91937.1 MAG: L-aspartate oxidase [Ignavibacteria bacterium RIFOXYA12_FULL_35_25]OGU95122.1 MAG: L-aspartate oxidase [Ignavibacteria bacterium RIFOXYB12_FULL_35_14]OGV01783.1 MAG: L-aspartate o
MLKTDVLIIGSGIAGLFAAIKISEFANVILVTKKDKAESNTNYAQGGIASVIDKSDSFEKHINDTLIAGAGLCNSKAVELMVKEGPDRIKELMALGTQFTQKSGKLDLVREGGHSMPRIVHAKDLTGKEIERALISMTNNIKNIHVIENTLAIDLITEHNIPDLRNSPLDKRNCWGTYVLDGNQGKVVTINSKVTILATGGLGQVYQHTTNPLIATGDGFAMVYRAGARIGNMEFVQFHPTSYYEPNKNTTAGKTSFLISEAVRGFGGILRTKKGEAFMAKYDSREELAPRDIVARAIDSEIKKSGEEFVYLDITHKSKDEIIQHFPNIYQTCFNSGIDITQNFIPVVPAAHYACGGVKVNEFSQTTINGLFACGEVSMTGVHGANRLASNSLLEAIVYANRASIKIKEMLKDYDTSIPEIPHWDDSGTLSSDELVLITHSLKEAKQTMWDYVGIVRSNNRLERAQRRITNLSDEIEHLYKKTKVFNDIIELRNIISCAGMIIQSALLRKESRGLHYTIDYPNLDDKSKPKDTIIQNREL